MFKIAIDAMGGDHAPRAVVKGVNKAIATFPEIEVLLFGDEAQIKPLLTVEERVTIIHTDEVVASDGEPVATLKPI